MNFSRQASKARGIGLKINPSSLRKTALARMTTHPESDISTAQQPFGT
jgi:hypothetical protein